MPTFDITRPKDIIRLSVDRTGAIPFTVTNVTATAIKTRLEVMPLAPADRDIFTIEGGNDRNMRPNETLNVHVMVAASQTTAPGSHKFWLKVVDIDSPDDRYAESQSIEFQVPDSRPADPPLSKAWWLLPIGILLVVAIGATSWYLYQHPRLEDYTKQKLDDAKYSLRRKGMTVKIVPDTKVENPTDEDKIIGQTVDGKPTGEGKRVRRGTEVTLDVAEASLLIESYRTKKVDDAANDLRSKGLKVTILTNHIVLSADQDRLVVEQTIDGKPTIEGQRVRRGTEIVLEGSAAMPSFRGYTLIAAKNELAQKGFPDPNVVNVPSLDPSTWDKVFQQEPDPGPPPKPGGGIIQLWVNVKPDPVPGGMPRVADGSKKYCPALAQLGSVGLTATEALMPISFTQPGANELVRAQNPDAGTPVLKGTTVTLTHSGGHISCSRIRSFVDRVDLSNFLIGK